MSSRQSGDEHDPDLADYFALSPDERLALARSHRVLDRPIETEVSGAGATSPASEEWLCEGFEALDDLEEDW